MGYDMYWENRPPGETEAVAAAQAEFNAAIADRDSIPKEETGRIEYPGAVPVGGSERWQAAQKKVTELYDRMHDIEKSYFQLNILGMSSTREVMSQLDMLAEELEMPEFPRPADFGLEDYPDEDADEAPHTDAEKRFLEAARQTTEGDTGGPIPDYKLGSNDGWLVTPGEICKSLEALKSREDVLAQLRAGGQLPVWFDDWVAWLRNAAEHGGFRVY